MRTFLVSRGRLLVFLPAAVTLLLLFVKLLAAPSMSWWWVVVAWWSPLLLAAIVAALFAVCYISGWGLGSGLRYAAKVDNRG